MSDLLSFDFFTQFHFIRPMWMLLIIPALFFASIMLRQVLRSGDWSKHIDSNLQAYMLDGAADKKSTAVSGLLTVTWIIAVFALAGPSWEKKAVPVVTNPDALVIILDMSLSMGAQDVAPSRAVRAVRKATDIVRGREDGVTAVVAYAGDAHTVVPFTDDSATVEHLITSLSPEIMPKLGSRPDKAISKALKLMQDAGITEASILLLTDGIQAKDVNRISPLLSEQINLSLIAIGTNEGAPIPTGEQGFLKDGAGNIVLPRLDTRPMQSLYEATGTRWRTLTYDDRDWMGLMTSPDFSKAQADKEQMLKTWIDSGYWLIFLLLPLALVSFRRGVVFTILLIPFLVTPEPAMAGAWRTDNQQAADLLKQDPAAAAELFTDPKWKATALYRAGKYDEAANVYATLDTATADYNRGNALAMAGDLVNAAKAYEAALSKQSDFPEAQQNLEEVKKLLEEQEQNQQQSDQNSDSEDQDSEEQNSQDQGSQNQDSKNQQSNDSDSGENSDQGEEQSQQSTDPDSENSDSKNSKSDDQQQNGEDSDQDPSDSQQSQKNDDEYAEQQAEKQAQEKAQEEAQQNDSADSEENDPEVTDANSTDEEKSDEQTDSKHNAKNNDKNQNPGEEPANAEPLDTFSNLSREEQTAMDSLLNQVPDNPGLLMQRKFLYQYRQNADQTEEDVLW